MREAREVSGCFFQANQPATINEARLASRTSAPVPMCMAGEASNASRFSDGPNMASTRPEIKGISQSAHTRMLNLWKLIAARSSLRSRTIVAQIAWTNMSKIAARPVTLWMLMVKLPAMRPISVVPTVSAVKPSQKKARCHHFSRPANFSLHTPMVYRLSAEIMATMEISRVVDIFILLMCRVSDHYLRR